MKFFDKFVNAIKVNEDEYDEDDFYDEEEDEEEDEYEDDKPKKGFFSRILGKHDDDYYDDEDEEEEEIPVKKSRSSERSERTERREPVRTEKPKAAAPVSNKVTPMRKRNGMEVCVIKPGNMEETRKIADTLLANCTVVLNLEGLDVEIAQRVIDFASGACYTINGSLQKVSSYIFILTPQSVGISGDITDILNGSIPTMRNNL